MSFFMSKTFSKKQTLILIVRLFVLFVLTAGNAGSSSVRMITNMGNIDVELFDDVAAVTVANLTVYDASSIGTPFGALPLLDSSLTTENLVTVSDMIVTVDPRAGDVDNSGQIDMADVILSLQAMTERICLAALLKKQM